MSAEASRPAAAVPGLIRSDPHGPGIHRERTSGGFRYRDSSGAEVSDPETAGRITVTDEAVRSVVRALIRSDNGLDTLFGVEHDGIWRPLRSHEVSSYIATHADGHFTAKEFRTWNATVLMALQLANGVAEWLGDTPTVARSSYIDPRVIIRYESDGQLTAIPRLPAVLPAAAEAEVAVAALLAADVSGPGAADGGHPGAVT